MTALFGWEDRYLLGSIGQALATYAGRGMGYEVSDIGVEYQASPGALRNLHLIGADLAGPDLLFTHPGSCFAADVKTSGLYQPLAEQMTWIYSTRHLTALETYGMNRKIPVYFQFVDPFRRLVYLCDPLHARYIAERHYGDWRVRARNLPRYWYWFGEPDKAA